MTKLCACGCGQPTVSPKATWLTGHNPKRGISITPRNPTSTGAPPASKREAHRYAIQSRIEQRVREKAPMRRVQS